MEFFKRHPALVSFIGIRAADEIGAQMLGVAVGWYVYSATHNPMSLAFVGLLRFLPNFSMALFAGHLADRVDRRRIIGLASLVQSLTAIVFFVLMLTHTPSVEQVYILLLLFGLADAFTSPSMSAVLPHQVQVIEFPRAVAITSSARQLCTLLGPAIGGLIYALNAPATFAVIAVLYLSAAVFSRGLINRRPENSGSAPVVPAQQETDGSILGGIRYIRSNRVLFGIISLDLFAVLLGGVTALLPIYAKDILAVGVSGLGWLQSATGIGSAIVGLILTRRAIERKAGKLMLWCVAGFGMATLVFAVSKNFWLSFAALAVAGAFDMVSMVIRQILVQVATPDAMRGRVSAVNGVFIGASNSLGEFESGSVAALIGAVPAAVVGGIGTLVVVLLWTWIFPELPRADRLVAEELTSRG